MTDLLQEVDDMMRQEKLAKLWHEHGNFIIGTILAIILATGLVSAYNSWSSHVRATETAALMDAMEKPDFAAHAAEALKDFRPGLKSVGLMNAAAKALKDKKPEEAAALLKAVAEDSGAPADLADLAVIMEMRLTKPEARAGFLEKLETIAGSSASPWKFHAALEAAVLKAETQDYEGARQLLLPLLAGDAALDDSLPPGIIERARALDHVYTLKGQAKTPGKAEKAAEQG